MLVPTIDIKLELQMRGVEHRDAFEKVDLARRLAKARVTYPSLDNPQPAAATAADGENNRNNCNTAFDLRKEEGGEEDEVERGPFGEGSGCGQKTTKSVSADLESAPQQEVQKQKGKGEGEDTDPFHARDVSKATRMGKQAVTRELHAMGISYSRLSDLSLLARQYASGRGEARRDAKEARQFQTEQELEGRLEVAKLLSLGRTGLESRLRAAGFRFSAQASDIDLARALLANMSGDISTSGTSSVVNNEKGAKIGSPEEGTEDDGEEGARGEGDRGSGWEGWTPGEQWGRAMSGLPWNIGQQQKENDEESKERGEGGREGKRGRTSKMWRGSWEEENGSETDWSVGGNAGSSASSAGEEGSADIDGRELAGATAAKAGKRDRNIDLQARADRMSSRELMKALDSLGARYRILGPRPELQRAFVSAVLAQENQAVGSRKGRASGGGAGMSEEGRSNGKIVPLSPYAAEGEQPSEKYRHVGFETYQSALRWARQLTFDDVLEELRFRGVQCNPKADYNILTRLLVDEVLADEELMKAEDQGESNGTVHREV